MCRSDGSCSTPEPLETQSSVSAPQAAGARKVAGAALPTQPAEAQRSAPLPAAKRQMAEELPAPSRAKKASVRSSFNIPSGSVEQRVEGVLCNICGGGNGWSEKVNTQNSGSSLGTPC